MASQYGQAIREEFRNAGMDTVCDWLHPSRDYITEENKSVRIMHVYTVSVSPDHFYYIISTWITNYRRY